MNRRDTIKTIAASAFMGFAGLVNAEQEAEMQWSDGEVKQMQKEIDELSKRIMTEQATYEEVVEIINKIWDDLEHAPPTVHLMDSPTACKNVKKDHEEFESYWSFHFVADAAKFQVMANHGLEIDAEGLKTLVDWTRCCPFILFNDTTVYVSKRPTILQLKQDKSLHYCEFADGWNVDRRNEN
jgi:hypothetical protein